MKASKFWTRATYFNWKKKYDGLLLSADTMIVADNVSVDTICAHRLVVLNIVRLTNRVMRCQLRGSHVKGSVNGRV